MSATHVTSGLLKNGVGASRVFCPAQTPSTHLLDFLCTRYRGVDATVWQQRLLNGDVRNHAGQAYTLDAPYPAQQTVYYFRELAQEARLPYEETIVYQDDCLIVADKPHFLPVIPSGSYVQETLLVRLKRRLNLPDLVPLHRIDRDTAGLVLFGVKPAQRGAYQNLFRDRKVRKTYWAIAAYQDTLAQLLNEKTAQNQRYSIINHLSDAENFMQMQPIQGAIPNAHTDIIQIERLVSMPHLARYTLAPLTGKRHQLRVHMLGLGVPIMGDQIYPTLLPERDISQGEHEPLQLLAQSIGFTDPITQQARYFESKRCLEFTG
jgi:tRNA pseudouridine32 synthase / 23S rRNA pseudouridine746 synthase